MPRVMNGSMALKVSAYSILIISLSAQMKHPIIGISSHAVVVIWCETVMEVRLAECARADSRGRNSTHIPVKNTPTYAFTRVYPAWYIPSVSVPAFLFRYIMNR